MSVARAEAQLATALLIELMAVLAEEGGREEDAPTAPAGPTVGLVRVATAA